MYLSLSLKFQVGLIIEESSLILLQRFVWIFMCDARSQVAQAQGSKAFRPDSKGMYVYLPAEIGNTVERK